MCACGGIHHWQQQKQPGSNLEEQQQQQQRVKRNDNCPWWILAAAASWLIKLTHLVKNTAGFYSEDLGYVHFILLED